MFSGILACFRNIRLYDVVHHIADVETIFVILFSIIRVWGWDIFNQFLGRILVGIVGDYAPTTVTVILVDIVMGIGRAHV